PVLAADGSLTSPYQAADKPNAPPNCPASCTSGLIPQNSLQDETPYPSCADRPKKASPCGTSNGLSSTAEVKINGPSFYGDVSTPASPRLSGQGGAIPGLSHRQQPWPRPTTPPAACGLLNHVAGAVVKTENAAGPVSCPHKVAVPVTTLLASIPSSCFSLEAATAWQRKNTQAQIGPLLATDLGAADSPLTATWALTPPQAAVGEGGSAIAPAHGFCSSAPPPGECAMAWGGLRALAPPCPKSRIKASLLQKAGCLFSTENGVRFAMGTWVMPREQSRLCLAIVSSTAPVILPGCGHKINAGCRSEGPCCPCCGFSLLCSLAALGLNVQWMLPKAGFLCFWPGPPPSPLPRDATSFPKGDHDNGATVCHCKSQTMRALAAARTCWEQRPSQKLNLDQRVEE
ncbi:PHD finger protein 12-like, partial [Python bivittatus]|uniref:PHD finger protein 12-like n=1 Tax=Python bivittatus TaxID=176946 RepID=A0A9F2RFU8_PYTBI